MGKVLLHHLDHRQRSGAVVDGEHQQLGLVSAGSMQQIKTTGIAIEDLITIFAQRLYLAGILLEDGGADAVPVQQTPHDLTETAEARVIVKLKSASPLKQIQAAGQVQTLGQRIGIAAQLIGQPTPDTQVMRASGMEEAASCGVPCMRRYAVRCRPCAVRRYRRASYASGIADPGSVDLVAAARVVHVSPSRGPR